MGRDGKMHSHCSLLDFNVYFKYNALTMADIANYSNQSNSCYGYGIFFNIS